MGWSHGKEMLSKDRPDTGKGSFYANPFVDNPAEVTAPAGREAEMSCVFYAFFIESVVF